MRKILMFMIISPLFLTNCKKDKGNASVYDVSMGISYKDKSGNDLLDTNSKVHYSEKDFHVYHVTNGVKKEYVLTPNLDGYGKSNIFRDTLYNHTYALSVSLAETTLLELNKNTTDTITCVIYKSDGIQIVTKVWYNGVLKWDFTNQLPSIITIIK